ncbi:MAG: LuxR C-terminal-related transcriptional regulator [bacterium]|nr:LuxR C-terminal-related transcriptional regulator [bacterium]
MLHVINLYHLLSVSSGAAAFFLIVILVAKFRRSLLKRYLALFCSITFVVFGIALQVYRFYLVPDQSPFMFTVIWGITKLGLVSLIFTLPWFTHHLVDDPKRKRKNVLFACMAVLVLILRFFPYEFILNPRLVPMAAIFSFYSFSVILLGTVGYSCFVAYRQIRQRKDRQMMDIFKAVVSITLLLFFAFLWDMNHQVLSDVLWVVPKELAFTPGVYLIWNLVFLTFGAQYLIMTPVLQLNDDTTKSYFDAYNITKREKEIMLLMFQGFNNQEIAQQLFISRATVKTHIHHVYDKVGVSGRVDLLNQYQNHLLASN